MFNFEDWFLIYSETYKSARDLFHNQFGAPDGVWKGKFKKDLSRPDLYPIFEGKATLENNCNEALERLRADIKVKRKQRDKGKHRSLWVLPMMSVYVGQGEKGRRYTWDIASVTETPAVKPDDGRFAKVNELKKIKKGSTEVAQSHLAQIKAKLWKYPKD